MREEKYMDNRKKIITYSVIVIVSLLLLIIGASYAYFTVTSTNSFGTKTINASAPDVGSVTLTSGSSLTMNLTAAQMMKGSSNIYYYASENGVTTTSTWPIVATATVTGNGIFNCDYTLEITKSATNDLYTAFQNWSNKSSGIIRLTIGTTSYDFNTANLFTNNKITYTGSFKYIKSDLAGRLKTRLFLTNLKNKDQNALANKDITLTWTATAFSCSAVEEPTYYYAFSELTDNWLTEPLTSANGYYYYLKGTSSEAYYACVVFNGIEYCIPPNSWGNSLIYKSDLEAISGVTCNYNDSSALECFDSSNRIRITNNGMVLSSKSNSFYNCIINPDGTFYGSVD